MPSKKQYNLVHNDEYDTRIPLHSEEAFHRGIVFHAKVIQRLLDLNLENVNLNFKNVVGLESVIVKS
ncbi:hypothetical protein E2986_13490 [Frieseomelitta varia]|uniref:Uncharacterized protein n=1 Tax=Frieseomelitta varia TaxID=561572 RepID=A0A833RQT4_9HYME|nr:hypothetical protein E2986_13490 [Frieseomelitta varia]